MAKDRLNASVNLFGAVAILLLDNGILPRWVYRVYKTIEVAVETKDFSDTFTQLLQGLGKSLPPKTHSDGHLFGQSVTGWVNELGIGNHPVFLYAIIAVLLAIIIYLLGRSGGKGVKP